MIAPHTPCLEQIRYAMLEHMTTEQGKPAPNEHTAHAMKQPMHRNSVNDVYLQGADEVAFAVQPILALELQPELLQVARHILPRQTLHIHHLHVRSAVDMLI